MPRLPVPSVGVSECNPEMHCTYWLVPHAHILIQEGTTLVSHPLPDVFEKYDVHG
jgi:hypothetical protein